MHRATILLACLTLLFLRVAIGSADEARPNILWITAEDHGPHLGCYGDRYATTPRLDALATQGMIYEHVWSVAPVCAPARTTIITGLYPSATGAEHMRSLVALPDAFKLFPQVLREAGYYCSNNSKEDYNVQPRGQVWDESSAQAHWRKRTAGQPFFAVFNFTLTHESQIRRRPHRATHDPAKVRVPAYHPDEPEVRQDWAQYHDCLTEVDTAAGKILDDLAADELADDTIVFYFSDHGPGLPRSKRTPCDSGLHVPLILHVPERWRALAPEDYRVGGRSSRLVSFVDLAPTVLSLAGIEPPAHLHGRAFAGKFPAKAPEFLHGLRGRMDERYDCVRSVTDGRFVYVRNFRPELPAGQHVEYMFATPTTQVWKRRFDEGRLRPEQAQFWQPRAAEELYDLTADPDEVEDLATKTEHSERLARMRRALREQVLSVADIGLLPEAEMQHRAGKDAPWTLGHDAARYDVARVFEAADFATSCGIDGVPRLREMLDEQDSAVRYWAARGIGRLGAEALLATNEMLPMLLEDPSPSVRCAAAETLGLHGTSEQRRQAGRVLLEVVNQHGEGFYVLLEALNTIDRLQLTANELPHRDASLRSLLSHQRSWPARGRDGVSRLLTSLGIQTARDE